MTDGQHIKKGVQFFFRAHGKQLIDLSDVPLLRWVASLHIEDKGLEQIQLRTVPKMVAPLTAGIFDDHIAKKLRH